MSWRGELVAVTMSLTAIAGCALVAYLFFHPYL
jgi:hypothetical protein